jgi:peroxiredoxin family protein
MPIKINKKEYPIRVTMWALLTFKRDKGKPVTDLKQDDLEEMLYYSWLCVRGACMQDAVTFDMDFEEYVKQVEGDPLEVLVEGKIEEVKKKKAKP